MMEGSDDVCLHIFLGDCPAAQGQVPSRLETSQGWGGSLW